MKRKLTAIMFTDIVGYSRIMSSNEEKGLELLSYQNNILLKIVKEYNGTILKRMGDALFIDFSSSINAIECGIALQNNLKEYNQDKSGDHQFLLRIGLHIGDVVIHDDDLFGEGINVAARLEPLAEPGGICMSQAFYDSVKVKSDFSAIRIGEVDLKNILEKYTVYKIPSFYVDDYNEPAKDNKDSDFHINYEIKDIKKLPPPKRSIGETSVNVIFGYMFFVVLVAFITISLIIDNRITKKDITNPKRLVAQLKEQPDSATELIRGFLDKRVLATVDTFNLDDGSIDSIGNIIRLDLNRIIELGSVTYKNNQLGQLDITRDLRQQLIDIHEKGDHSKETRLLLGQIFYGSISNEPISIIDLFFENIHLVVYDSSTFIINLLAIISGIYYLSLSSIRITFTDIRDVDKVLIHFVDQIGYKEPYREKGQMVFKPSLWQRIIWTSSSIRARIDGNSIYLIGNIPIIRRLEKMFRSYGA